MQNKIIYITGRKGSGKTTLAAELTQRKVDAGFRTVVVSPMGGINFVAPFVRTRAELLNPILDDSSFIVQVDREFDLTASVFKYVYLCGNITLVVDEIDLYIPNGQPDEYLLNIIRYGRHKRIDLIGISQRPARVVRDLTAQADIICIFQSTENRDVDYLAGRIGRENADKIRGLNQFDYAVYSAYDGKIIGTGRTKSSPVNL